MNRRVFLSAVTGGLLAAPLAALLSFALVLAPAAAQDHQRAAVPGEVDTA
jgi:hypothetical protein